MTFATVSVDRFHLTFNIDKYDFALREIEYSGYLENIEAVVNCPVPHNTRKILRFVCLTSYFRRFLPNFSTVAKPL